MRICEVIPRPNWVLSITADDGRVGLFDISPYLDFEAFAPLKNPDEFSRIINGSYFVEWECGADLSADTIEAHWTVVSSTAENLLANSGQQTKSNQPWKR